MSSPSLRRSLRQRGSAGPCGGMGAEIEPAVLRRLPLRTAAAMAVVALVAPGGLSPALAQFSPNCLRNGRPEACAITPAPEPAQAQAVAGNRPSIGQGRAAQASSLTVMYADHSAYRLIKDESLCRHRGMISECPATIIPSNGYGTPINARYRGTAYEGGYRHAYSSPGLTITFFFVD